MRSGAARRAGALLHNFFESGLPGKHAAQRRFTPVTPSHSVTPNPDHLASLVPIDFLFDYIPVGAFWTILLIVHGRLPVALLGALTHQAAAVLLPLRPGAAAGSFVARFRAVSGAR